MDIVNQSGAEGKGFQLFFLYILFAFLIILFLIGLLYMFGAQHGISSPTGLNATFSILPQP